MPKKDKKESTKKSQSRKRKRKLSKKARLTIIARWIQEQLDEHVLSEKLIEHILRLEKEYEKKFDK